MSGAGVRPGADTRHIFTVDVEEYFQVHAFRSLVHPDEWGCFPSRVALGTERLLEVLEEADTRATFFILGWIAERHPGLVRRIAGAGHEVASHGYGHDRVHELDPASFRDDARRSKRILEDVSGTTVLGYRAPRFSLESETEWMLEVLADEGYRYDSSLVPARMLGGGGYPGAGRWPQIVPTPSGPLLELPLATARWAGLTLPAAGGAYLRHFPYALVRTGFRQAEDDGQPGVFYIHPWELDPDQPKFSATLTARVRHYRNLARTGGRIRKLLAEFEFTSARERFGLDDGDRRESGSGGAGENGAGRTRRIGS